MSKKIYYHGNQNKKHRFSELKPCFFTEDKEYAKGYGDYVYPYIIETKKPFDTATDEEARYIYNNFYLKSDLAEDNIFLDKGQHISFINADNFFAWLATEKQLNNITEYDSIIVKEFSNDISQYSTNLSIVPLNINQIKPIKTLTKKIKL